LNIWKDSYKSGRWIATLKEIQPQSTDVLLTFDSGNKEQGITTIAVPLVEYQKLEPMSPESECEIKAFAKGDEARKACHVREEVLPVLLDKRAFTKVPIAALRATIDYWNKQGRNHLVGAIVNWSIRKD
jgi:hypothetical protein